MLKGAHTKVKIPTKYVKIVGVIVIAGALYWFSRSFLSVTPSEIRDWILSFGLLSPILYVVLYTIRPLLLFPASVLSLAGGLAFGAVMGTVYTIIGATLGAIVSFLAARKLGKNLANKEWKGNAKKVQTQMEKNGFQYVLLLRLIPIINFDLISYLAGVSKVRLSAFTLGTLLGIIPGTFAYNFLGSSLVGGNLTLIATAIIVFLLIMFIPILIRKKMKGKNLPDIEIEENNKKEE